MRDTSPEGKGKLRRNWTQKAIDLAMRGHWKEAIRVNESILNLFPTDIEARNRIGKAYLELGEYQKALGAYRSALEIAPNNVIARKNIRRLENLTASSAPPVKRRAERISPHLFLGEMGKTVITTLRQTASPSILASFAAGDPVTLLADKGMVRVVSETGEVLGLLEPGLSRRLINLQKSGNRYVAALIAVDDSQVRVIVRETYRHPSQAGRPSFPVENGQTPRPYAKGFVRYLEEDEDLLGPVLDDEEKDTELGLDIMDDDDVDLFKDAEDLVTDDDDLD